MEVSYNLWHGCTKKSEGCKHCYVYRRDEQFGKDASQCTKTKAFYKPILKKKNGEYKYPSGTLFDTCFTSDFFLKEADVYRKEALEIIKERKDCTFFCLTKRPERIMECLSDPKQYPNLIIYCTMENQKRFDERIQIYLDLPLKKKGIILEPMLGPIDFRGLVDERIFEVVVGGESGKDARMLDFNWVKDIKRQCEKAHVSFRFRQTGALIKVDGRLYRIKRKDQFDQARKAFNNRSVQAHD